MNAETNININKNKNKKKKRSPGLIAGIILVGLMIVLLVTLAMFMSYDEVTNVFQAGKLDIVLTEPNWKPSKAVNIVPNAVLDKDPYITNNEVKACVFLKVTVPYATVQIENNSNSKGSLLSHDNNTTYADVPMYKFVVKESTSTYTASSTNAAVTDDSVNGDSTKTYIYNKDYTSADQFVNKGWKLINNDDNPYTSKDTTAKTYTYLYAYVFTDSNNNDAPKDEMAPLITGATTQTPLFDKIILVNFRDNRKENDKGEASDAVRVTGVGEMPGNRNYSILVQAYGIQADYLGSNGTNITDPTGVWNVLQSTNGS